MFRHTLIITAKNIQMRYSQNVIYKKYTKYMEQIKNICILHAENII